MNWTRMRIKKSKIIFRLQFGEMETRKKCRRTFAMRNGIYFERTKETCRRQHEGLAVQHGKGLAVVHNCWIIPRILGKFKTGSERKNKTYKQESTGLPVPDQCSKSMEIWPSCDGEREHVINKLQCGIKYGVPESSVSRYIKG